MRRGYRGTIGETLKTVSYSRKKAGSSSRRRISTVNLFFPAIQSPFRDLKASMVNLKLSPICVARLFMEWYCQPDWPLLTDRFSSACAQRDPIRRNSIVLENPTNSRGPCKQGSRTFLRSEISTGSVDVAAVRGVAGVRAPKVRATSIGARERKETRATRQISIRVQIREPVLGPLSGRQARYTVAI